MLDNYKSDENILKTLIQRNIFPTIYYNEFKTSNLIIKNTSSPSIRVLQKTNVIYQFKCPLGNCVSENNNIYVGLTSTTLPRPDWVQSQVKSYQRPKNGIWGLLA